MVHDLRDLIREQISMARHGFRPFTAAMIDLRNLKEVQAHAMQISLE